MVKEQEEGGSGLGGHVGSRNGLFLRLQMLRAISIQMAPSGRWSQRFVEKLRAKEVWGIQHFSYFLVAEYLSLQS